MPPKAKPKSDEPSKSRVQVHQPTTEVWDFENHWQKDFCDCCENCSMCMCAYCCTICFMSKLFMRTGECCCMWCIPGGLVALRTKLRTGFRIKGSVFKDFCASCCCPCCVAVQMTQELDKQEL